MENKKKIGIIILIIICLLVIVGIVLILFKGTANDIDKTKKIIVQEIFGEYETKEITNNEDIEKIIKIINNRTPMSEDEVVPYGGFPRYRLELLDRKDEIILSIDFYVYSNNEDDGYISIDDNGYNIDVKALLEIIN